MSDFDPANFAALEPKQFAKLVHLLLGAEKVPLIQKRAVRLDLGEGFLELGLVMSSLYFLSKRKLFPVIGAIAAVAGTVLGIVGFLV